MESQESSEAWSSLSMPSNVHSMEDSLKTDALEGTREGSDDGQSSGGEEIESPLRSEKIHPSPAGAVDGHATPIQRSSSCGGDGALQSKTEDEYAPASSLDPGENRACGLHISHFAQHLYLDHFPLKLLANDPYIGVRSLKRQPVPPYAA